MRNMGNPALILSKDFSEKINIRLTGGGGIGMNHTTWRADNGKTIFFIRHAESQHNLSPTDYTLPDPRLTQNGVLQAQRIRDTIPLDALANLQLMVTSPLQRCLQSCVLSFRPEIEWHHVPLEILPDLQETSIYPCDIGSSRQTLIDQFPQLEQELKMGLPIEDWNQKSACDCQPDALRERASRVIQWLLRRPERVIVVMTHNGMLRQLLGDDLWTDQGRSPHGFANGECRRLLLNGLDGSLSATAGIMVLDQTFSHEISAIGHVD